MAIHYNRFIDRYQDARGRFVKAVSGRRSSIARAEYKEAKELERVLSSAKVRELKEPTTFEISDINFHPEHEKLSLETETDLWDSVSDILQEYEDPDIIESNS
jgi:hypothetical protein